MKHRVGCAAFTVVGLGWLGFFMFDMLGATLGDCGGDRACQFYRPFVEGLVWWRGLAVALLLVLAYLFFRAFIRNDDNAE